jgi:DNA-binding protein Fis
MAMASILANAAQILGIDRVSLRRKLKRYPLGMALSRK